MVCLAIPIFFAHLSGFNVTFKEKKKTIGDHSIHDMVSGYFLSALLLPFLAFATDCDLFKN